MSVGKLETVSQAVAQMQLQVCRRALKFGTLAKTAIESSGASASKVNRFANSATNYTIDPSLFIDMTAKRDDGQFWDLGTREDQERLEQMQQEHQPDLLIGSALCTSFRALFHPNKKKAQTERMQDGDS